MNNTLRVSGKLTVFFILEMYCRKKTNIIQQRFSPILHNPNSKRTVVIIGPNETSFNVVQILCFISQFLWILSLTVSFLARLYSCTESLKFQHQLLVFPWHVRFSTFFSTASTFSQIPAIPTFLLGPFHNELDHFPKVDIKTMAEWLAVIAPNNFFTRSTLLETGQLLNI